MMVVGRSAGTEDIGYHGSLNIPEAKGVIGQPCCDAESLQSHCQSGRGVRL